MIVRVCERASRARLVSRVIVATDDAQIVDAVCAEGFDCRLTSASHETGTDRLAEVAATLDAELIVNVQGDEPLISPKTIDLAVEALGCDPTSVASTTCEPIESVEDFLDPNIVKVVLKAEGRALYFSRAPIPFPRDAGTAAGIGTAVQSACRKHTGLYVYRRSFLLQYARMPQTPLEKLEKLEQLRILEHGFDIRVVEAPERSIGVDTPADLERVRDIWNSIYRTDS